MQDNTFTELQQAFTRLNIDDDEAVRKWFTDHTYLTNSDHAQIAGKSKWWISRLRHRVGLSASPPKTKTKPRNRRISTVVIDVPSNWDTKEWLEKAISLYSLKQIAKAVNRSRTVLRKRLKRWNIINKPYKESVKSNNRCCTKAWVYDHYVTKGLSQSRCANLAGVSHATFTNWLNRFGIPVRRLGQPCSSMPQFWARKLIFGLEQLDIIRKVYYRSDHIHVRFKHRVWESYYLNRTGKRRFYSYNVTSDDCRLLCIPEIARQYEEDFDSYEYAAHICINRNEFDNASFLEQRMAIHRFCYQIVSRGWIWPKYPIEILETELTRIQDMRYEKYICTGGFTAFPKCGIRPAPGRRIIEHFFDIDEIWPVIRSAKRTTTILNRLAGKAVPFDTHNFLRAAIVGRIRIVDPVFYVALFKRLGITGTVLDLTPNHGSRAIACAVAGIEYRALRDDRLLRAINNGFADFVNLKYEMYDGGKVDLVICDNDLSVTTLDVMQYASVAKNILIFVPAKDKATVLGRGQPRTIIPVKARYYQGFDHLFLY